MEEESFTDRVIAVISSIPEGRVVSYGQVAALAGNPRGARQVVRVLHSSSRRHDLPWHRVINAQGEISLAPTMGGDLQRSLLAAEGVELDVRGRVDFERFGYQG